MRSVTLTPPPGLFAAVQVQTDDDTIIGAAIALRETQTYDDDGNLVDVAKHPLASVTVTLKPHHPGPLTCLWVHEDSSLGIVETTVEPGKRQKVRR